ncbi:alpha/beta hydrolase [Microbacterium schleiferi]|uniref:Alpha/beta hydrolase fold domain-containing protein n=1 Tax=Microbacterium schleiferi TaxID=69362 RepID=A0ABU7V9Z0_9MICO
MTVRTPPPIDPELQRVLASTPDVVTTLSAEEIPDLRLRSVQPTLDELTLSGEFELSHHRAPRGDGSEIDLVLLRPALREGAVPVLFHVHGGGLVVGNAYDELPALTRFAKRVGVAIMAVEYRLAPEHPYPAAIDDVYAGLTWTAEHAAQLGLDGERIVLHGVSAGGGLAAAAALRARDRREPSVFAQMLLCPMLDARNNSVSAQQMTGIGAWDRTANETAWTAYLGPNRDAPPADASPAAAADLSNLAPAFIDVGSAETFRDEDIAYAQQIWLAGGEAELHVWQGGVHGFHALAPDAAIAHDAQDARAQWLTRMLRREP